MIFIPKINETKAAVILSYTILGIGFVIPLLYTPVMLDILGQEEYGLYSLVQSIVGYLNLLSFGIGTSIVRYITLWRSQKTKEDVRRLLGLFVTIYAVISMLVIIVGGILLFFTDSLFGNGLKDAEIEKMRILMVIMTINIAISLPMSAFSAVMTAYERFLALKTISLIETIAAPLINLIILFVGFQSVGMAVAGLCVSVVNCVIYFSYCAVKLDIYPSFKHMPFGIFKELLVFSGFVFLSSLVDMLYWATDKVLIGAVVGTAAVAVYNIGNTFNSILRSLANTLSGIFAPRVTMMVGKEASPEELSEPIVRIGRLQYLIVSLVLSGFAVFGRKFLLYWAGPGYEDSYYVALLTMVPLGIPLIQNLAFNVLLAQNKHKFRSFLYLGIAILNIISTYLILPYYGVIGAAACTAVSFVLGQGIIMNIYYHKVIKLDIPRFWRNIAQMTIVPVFMIMGGLFLFENVYHITSLSMMLACAIIFTILFIILSWFISMNDYEKQLFGGLIRKLFCSKKQDDWRA